MSTTESIEACGRCPKCGSPTTIDRKRRGFVRHKVRRIIQSKQCTYGRGGRDRQK